MQKVYSLLRKNVKWRAVSLIFMAVQSNAFAAAQDSSNVSLNFTNQPIENVFIALEKQTGYTVFFSGSTLDGNTPITVKVSQVTLSNALAAVLRGKNITWTIKHKGIVLSKKPVVAEAPAEPVNAALDTVPMINVSGVVVDAKGNPIPAATVSLKGYPRGQGTDNMGRFSFTRVPGNGTLVFSSLGYDPKQVRIAGRGEIRVALDSAIRDIQGVEVVSTGYQSLPKERATGSFVQLGNELISRNPSPKVLDRILNITNSLKFEPVSIGNASGNSTNISIRGFSTINANMRPLIVVDGFPYDEFNNPGNTGQFTFNPLNNINPNDIESITILRDAAAASIWGTRSGNGVIVITTKKGRFNQKPRIEFRSNLDVIGKPQIKKLPIISSSDMIAFERKRFGTGYYNRNDDIYPGLGVFSPLPGSIEILLAARRGDITSSEAEEKLISLSNHDVRDDINKYFLQNEIIQQYNINLSGGSDKFQYYTSIGYDNTRSSNIGTRYTRFTFRLDNTYKINKFIDVNTYIQYTNSKSTNNGFNYNSLLALGTSQTSPYTLLADNAGTPLHVSKSSTLRIPYLDTLNMNGLLNWHYKPLEERKLIDNITTFFSTRLGGDIRFKINKLINISIKGQYEKAVENNTDHKNILSYELRNLINSYMYYDPNGIPQYPFPIGGSLTTNYSDKTSWNIRSQLNINKAFGDHQINGILGLEYSELERSLRSETKYGYDHSKSIFIGNLSYNTIYPLRPSGSATLPNFNDINSFIDRTNSYFGNLGYTFRSKYILTISGRVDASNFFGSKSNDRRIPLYSTGIGWNISSENFYKIPWLQYLKLRATYGYNGNMNNRATALPTARNQTGTAYNLHTEPYLELLTPANPGLTWEKIKVTNIGIDYAVLKNRITGSIEYYIKNGINLIGLIPIETTTGVNTYTTNYAKMKGQGVDIIVNSLNIKKAFSWETKILFSYNTDKITEYSVPDDIKNSISANVTYFSFIVGKPLLKLYSYPFAGLNPQNGDPMGYVDNVKTDYRSFMNTAKVSDLKYAGPATPQYFGSVMNTFSHKSLSLSTNIVYKFKYYLRRQSVNYSALYNNWGGHSDYALRWQKPGDELTTNIPSQPNSANSTRENFFSNTDALVFKGDHIRLQDIRLSVDLSKPVFKRNINNRSFQAYLFVNNLGIIWRKNDLSLDPDYFTQASIPPSKSVSVGAIVGF